MVEHVVLNRHKHRVITRVKSDYKMSASEPRRMPWIKYPKMPEVSSSGRGEFVVTEKIHGANLSIIASSISGTVSFAKRTAVLGTADDCEDFYSLRSSRLAHELRPRVLRVAEEAAATEIHIYGELFGGHYPHPNVSPVAGIQAVQKGIWYSPSLRFMAFDVRMDGSFLNYDRGRELCEAAGIMFVAPLFRGSLSECISFEHRFNSTIPLRLGLPPLSEPNLSEGVVIRPAAEPSSAKCNGRGLFKRKIPEFAEDRRYQNPEWKQIKRGGGYGNPSKAELVEMEVVSRVTEQRLASVLSKIGRVDSSDQVACRRLLLAMKEDVRESLTDEERQTLKCSPLIKEKLDSLCRQVIIAELVPNVSATSDPKLANA